VLWAQFPQPERQCCATMESYRSCEPGAQGTARVLLCYITLIVSSSMPYLVLLFISRAPTSAINTRDGRLSPMQSYCSFHIPQVVEDVSAVPPHVDRAVLAQALVIETVYLQSQPMTTMGY
jgi:hypothetical protein